MSANLSAEALRQFWFSEWHSLNSGLDGGIKEWIRSHSFEVDAAFTSSDNFQLRYVPERTPLKGIAYDCNRFSMAAIETFYGLKRTPPTVIKNSIPWLCIESYYAAFYSAHALLRLFGQSCTQLEHREIKAINDVISVYYKDTETEKARGGYYNIIVDVASNRIDFSRVVAKRPHQQLWNEFDTFLSSAIPKLSSGSLRYQAVLLQLQSLRRNLNHSGSSGGIWLSSIRHEVNYQHGLEAWFPYVGVKRSEVDKMVKLVASMPADSLAIDLDCHGENDLIRYFNTTNYMIALCCEVFQYIEQSSVKKVFPSDGPLKLLKLLAA